MPYVPGRRVKEVLCYMPLAQGFKRDYVPYIPGMRVERSCVLYVPSTRVHESVPGLYGVAFEKEGF